MPRTASADDRPSRMICPSCFSSRFVTDFKKDGAAFNPHRVTPRAALIGGDGLAGSQAQFPAVQRAGHQIAMHQALRQWPALVRALVAQRKHLATRGAKNGNVAAGRAHHATTQARNFFKRADRLPFSHFCSPVLQSESISYSFFSTPAMRSAHGSRASCNSASRRP